MTPLGARDPLARPWTHTIAATMMRLTAMPQCGVVPTIASAITMLARAQLPAKASCTKFLYVASCSGTSFPVAVAYSTGPCSAIESLQNAAQPSGRGLAQMRRQGNGGGELP